MRYQSLDCAPRVRLSSGGPGRDPNPEFPPRNPISDRLRLPVSRSGYRKKGWRVAQPKDPPAPSLAIRYGPLVEPEATSRLDQPGHPGRRTDRMLDRTSTRRGSLKTQQTSCLRVDGARDWTPQLVSLAQFTTKCTDFDSSASRGPRLPMESAGRATNP